MDSSYLTNPANFLIQTVFGLYIIAVLLRFLFQLVKADFYNPLSQFLVKATNPPLKILRRFIPGFAGLDLAALVLAWLLKYAELLLITLLGGLSASIAPLFWAIPALLETTINIFLVAILIQVILSWVSPGGYNPIIGLINSLTEPLLKPARRLIPAMGGLDLSPMVVMVGLVLLKMLLLPPLLMITGSPIH